MNEFYECTSEGSDCLQKRFDGILFSSSLRVIPRSVLNLLNLNTALFTEVTGNRCIQLFYKRHPVSESGFTETYIYIQPLCSFCLAKNGPNLHAQHSLR